ncbi:hypothetical protein [Pseudanabaena sp. UWO310]|uniref:hypothetical protein n=1 Tax=Pseudanabaena sp. UWO310 TaxID=2480795 RepID=UPI00115737C4|nr:hypothetical protein [Pseudanabaena sp. UWO310]TYQ25609.1 hypothetical protein PseudUWO310_18760 [Pseudanabaena sp. UWO310]
MNRKNFVRFIYLSGGIALQRLYTNEAEAGVPFLALISGAILFLDLVDKAFNVGEKVSGVFGIRNDSNRTQSGTIAINVFDSSKSSNPEISITQNLTIPPNAQQTYQLPAIQPSSPGEKIIEIRTGLNRLSKNFRYGSYCCDSRGTRRCPVPYSLDLGTECFCSGQGIGNICE